MKIWGWGGRGGTAPLGPRIAPSLTITNINPYTTKKKNTHTHTKKNTKTTPPQPRSWGEEVGKIDGSLGRGGSTINSNWVRMATWWESFGETSGDVETEIGGGASETRGVIGGEFRGEIGWWWSLIGCWHGLGSWSCHCPIGRISGEEERLRE